MSDVAPSVAVTPKSRKQGRSPAYPGISLKEAIAKAEALYKQEGKYPAPMPSAFAAWGFSIKSSGGRETRAALRYFGLITIEGDNETGKVKLTDDALRVLLDTREDQTEKQAIIRRLALNPAIHAKLFKLYPDGIKSEASVAHDLVFADGYNKSAADELVAEFRETADYAKLFQPATILDKPPTDERESDPPVVSRVVSPAVGAVVQTQPPAYQGRQVRIMEGERELLTGLLSKGANFRLVVQGHIGVKEIETLIKKLEIDKEILAEPDPPEPPTAEDVASQLLSAARSSPAAAAHASVSLLITLHQKAELRERGYTDEQISEMKPEEAHRVLGLIN
jgi:hypothetical protein